MGLFCIVLGTVAYGLGTTENPKAVSPGNEIRATVIDQVCPTFSWAAVPGATSYQIAVFEMSERFEGLSYYENQAALSSPVLIKKISGSATSWTPSLEQALNNGGRYVWFVKAQDAYGTCAWSVGKKFAVRASLGLSGIKEKVKEQLEAKGVKGDLVDEAFKGIQSEKTNSKSGGELKDKEQALEEKEAQTKLKSQGNKEVKSKENQTAAGTGDFTAGALGSEGDTNQNVYYGTGAGAGLDLSAEGAFENSFFGYAAGMYTTSGDYNSFVGAWAGNNNTTGGNNTFVGSYAGRDNTTGDYNTFLGNAAGLYNTTGYDNTFIGEGAGFFNKEGDRNTFIGYSAGKDNEANSNTFLGAYTGLTNTTGSLNVFIGYDAGHYESGSHKLYIENSGSSLPLIYGEFDNDLLTINGELNVTDSNINVDTASTRARFKLQADGGGTNTDDFFNFTMRNDYGDVTLSVRDSSAGVWLPMLSYEYLNNKVDFKDNDIVTTGTISSGGGAYTSGGAWIEASSREFKENIMELDQEESLQALESLKPVRYNYKNKKGEEFLGFIAEDVPDLVAMNGRKGMRAMDIVAVLTKVVQDQQKKISDQDQINHKMSELLRKQIEHLKEQNKIIKALKERINKLEQK